MILPHIRDTDFIPESMGPDPLVFANLPDPVRSRLNLLNPAKAREIDQAFGKFQYEPDHRAIGSGGSDFFAQPEKYRKIEHLLVIRPLPPDEIKNWLETRLPANDQTRQNQWLVSGRADLSFVVERALFVAHCEQFFQLARDAAFITPPDESWLLIWEYQGFLTLYQCNPPTPA